MDSNLHGALRLNVLKTERESRYAGFPVPFVSAFAVSSISTAVTALVMSGDTRLGSGVRYGG